jgi:hypothetical protein
MSSSSSTRSGGSSSVIKREYSPEIGLDSQKFDEVRLRVILKEMEAIECIGAQ